MRFSKSNKPGKPQKILAVGGAVGVSLATLLLGVSVVVLSLRKVRVSLDLDLNQDKDQTHPSGEEPPVRSRGSWHRHAAR
jgi:hypothetical protein